METTLQPSLQQNARMRLAVIEAVELASLAFGFWALIMLLQLIAPDKTNLTDDLIFLAVTEVIVLGSWAIYNLYIRVARTLGPVLGHLIWVVAVIGTGSYFLWAWILLDANRFLMSRLFYRGEAPVEYSFSPRSRQRRYDWEEARKANTV
ncbi:MAG TPA: hypothetical protein VK900_10040 [Anaerolineales bacterium]|nr:hypothetical protein [Anaerolineales bacterium]